MSVVAGRLARLSLSPDARLRLRQRAEALLQARWPLSLLVMIGVALRLRRYQACYSLEVAESELSLNLLARSFAELLRPLDYDQAAPVGFLWIERLAIQVFGGHEYALRLFPALCGVASVFLMRSAARRLLAPAAAPVALALFAFSPLVIWYSAQVKQYSSDVAAALAVLVLVAPALETGVSRARGFMLACAGVLTVWLSHAAVFMLAASGIVLLTRAVQRREGREVLGLAGVGASWMASFAALYFLSLRYITRDDYLQSYWSLSFAPLPPTNFDELQWYVDNFFRIFQNPAGLLFEGIAAAVFLLGAAALLRDRRPAAAALLLPFGLAVLASGLHQYPFGGRLLLFLVPVMLLLVGQGFDEILRHTKATRAVIPALLAGLLVFDSSASETLKFVRPRPVEEMRPLMAQLAKRLRPEDILYIYCDSQYAFRYYAPRFGLEDRSFIRGRSSEGIWEDDLADLEDLKGYPRVWLIFSHVYEQNAVHSEEDFFVFHLERMGRRLDDLHTPGASAYLYDLAVQQPAAR